MGDHRVDVRREAVIPADPDVVWAIVAAAQRQAEWFPGMVTSTVKDDVRTVVAASGAIFLEKPPTCSLVQMDEVVAAAQGRNILRYRGRLCSFKQSASLQSAELRLQHVRLTVIPQ